MKRSILALALVVLPSLPAVAGETMKPGNWEITMKNLAESPEPFVTTQCMTAEDLQSQVLIAEDEVPEDKRGKDYDITGDDGDCAYEMRHRGNTLHVRTDCSGEISTTDVTYFAQSFTMTSDVESEGEKSHVEMSGKRIGDCTPTEEVQQN